MLSFKAHSPARLLLRKIQQHLLVLRDNMFPSEGFRLGVAGCPEGLPELQTVSQSTQAVCNLLHVPHLERQSAVINQPRESSCVRCETRLSTGQCLECTDTVGFEQTGLNEGIAGVDD